MNHNIRRPLYDGTRQVHALWFDIGLIGEAVARARVLRHWAPGARLHLVHGGYLLMLSAPRFARCSDLDGLPLCEQDGVLSSAPLAPDEHATTPPASLWLVRAARAHLINLAAAPRVNPAEWLDLRAIPLHLPLRPPRATSSAASGDAALNTTPVREILSGAVPPPSAQRDAFLERVGEAHRNAKGRSRGAAIASVLTGAAVILLGGIPLLVFKALGSLFGTRSGSGKPADTQTARRQRQAPAEPSALMQRLRALTTRLAVLTRASRVIGWRQAAYLRNMMELLEKGDLQEALRHAIPLDSLSKADRPAYGTPRPRARLKIGAPHRASTSIGLGDELERYLRATYRRTFERLDREGKIDEATYVLAELLKCGGEAVDYLERKERVKQAAQLAETLELDAAIAVRLWCMAGDIERAAQLARLGSAFATAIQLLERHKNPQADALRLLWADDLAFRGQLSEAAEAIWPLAGQRGKALAWLLEAERAGGTLGLRALTRKLALAPESLAASESGLLALLGDDGEQGVQRRERLAAELLSLTVHSSATKRLAAELMRPLLADRLEGGNTWDKQSLTKLLELSDGHAMKADLPQLALPPSGAGQALDARSEDVRIHLDERGLLTIHDARRLPDAHYLLALGEGGVVRIDGHGRQVAHFPVPATRLVLATGGQRALALVQRNSMWRVSRLDLIARTVSDWIAQPLSFWADQYDGLVWNAVIGNRLLAIDTSKDQLTPSWQVTDLPGKVFAFLEERGTQTLLLATGDDVQQWRYQLPARRLIQRDSFPLPSGHEWQLLPNSGRDAPTMVRLTFEQDDALVHVHHGAAAPFTITLKMTSSLRKLALRASLMLIHSHPEDGDTMRCLVADPITGRTLANLSLAACDKEGVHVEHDHILLFDQAGRLVDLSREDGRVRTFTLA